jgi:hypothetical protein
MGNFREEFSRTERTLARHPAAIKERLIAAAIAGIAALSGNEKELAKMPEELRDRFLTLMNELTSAGSGAQGSIHETVQKMSDGEAQIVVDEFLALSYDISRL